MHPHDENRPVTQAQLGGYLAGHPAGYRAGLRQPSIRAQLDVIVPQDVDIPRMASELLERFGIEPLPPATQIRRTLTDAESTAQAFTWQVMSLALELLNAIRIPCFERGLILDVTTVDDSRRLYRASFLFATVDHINPEWIVRCLRKARQLLAELATPDLHDETVEQLLENLHEQFVENGRKQIFGGDATIPVLKTAYGLNVPFMHLGSGIYQLGWGRYRRLSDRSASDLDSAIAVRATQNKLLCARLLRDAGLPAPVHAQATSAAHAITLAEAIGFPVVVKPADRDRGEGVTIDLVDAAAVVAAFDKAAALSKNVIVERQVPGVCQRILVAGNEVAYVVGRLPMGAEGDGVHTVRELITLYNKTDARKAKHLRKKSLPCDELAEQTLAQQGLRLDDVPAPGQMAWLRPIESTEWGGLPDVGTDRIHPDNCRIAIEAARCMGLQVAGVDLMTTDISRPWYENGAIINEVNYTPYLGLRLDYQREGVLQTVRGLVAHGTRIPVEVFVGDTDALAAAKARQQSLAQQGTRAFLSSHALTLDGDQELRLALSPDGLLKRGHALLMNAQVEALLLVIQTDEPLLQGLPVDAVNELHIINRHLLRSADHTPLDATAVDELLTLLHACCTPQDVREGT